MPNKEIIVIVGTRPELIKLAPIMLELRRRIGTKLTIVSTGQHKELLEQFWSVFALSPDYNLEIISHGQTLAGLTSRAITAIDGLIQQMIADGRNPEAIIAQGDTTTVMAASMVSFYRKIKFLHVEAGLRTSDIYQPFPEEFNRRVAAISAFHHFAPTTLSKNNLLRESVPDNAISVVGNTIVDAVNFIKASEAFQEADFQNVAVQAAFQSGNPLVLVTSHRRENQNGNLENIVEAIRILSEKHPDKFFIWPVHPNPAVRACIDVARPYLDKNVVLCEPLNYIELLKILDKAICALSDSGGIQEEAPSFKTPVLILRNTTERPEAVEMGYNKIVGTDVIPIIESFESFKPDYNNFVNPYGDGLAGVRVADFVENLLASDAAPTAV